MKPNEENASLPALTMPRLSSKLEAIADSLARFAAEFGLEINGNFPMRLATIGFANGVLLRLQDGAAAATLEQLLVAESIPPDLEIRDLTASFIGEFTDEPDWTHSVNCFLRRRWNDSADNSPVHDPKVHTLLRVLHGIRAGLVVARESPETAGKIAERIGTLWVENQFLSGCLYAWSDCDWIPPGPPFVEFVAACYRSGAAERWAMRKAVGELYLIAKALNNPWSLSFWVETGWNGGRNFVRNHPQDCKALLAEAGEKLLKEYHGLYERCILGTARSDGEVQVERATLKYLGELEDASLARSYCTGREPRRLARWAFDFTFWMGIFSAHPLPAGNG